MFFSVRFVLANLGTYLAYALIVARMLNICIKYPKIIYKVWGRLKETPLKIAMKRLSIRIPRYHYKLLIFWSRAKGQSVSGMAERIVQARLEANEEQIDHMIQSEADDLNISVAEVKEQWLKDAKYDPSIFSEE